MLIRDEMLYDRRIVDRNIQAGRISKSDYEKHLRSLKDLSDESETQESDMTHIDHEIPAVEDTDEDEL